MATVPLVQVRHIRRLVEKEGPRPMPFFDRVFGGAKPRNRPPSPVFNCAEYAVNQIKQSGKEPWFKTVRDHLNDRQKNYGK